MKVIVTATTVRCVCVSKRTQRRSQRTKSHARVNLQTYIDHDDAQRLDFYGLGRRPVRNVRKESFSTFTLLAQDVIPSDVADAKEFFRVARAQEEKEKIKCPPRFPRKIIFSCPFTIDAQMRLACVGLHSSHEEKTNF